MYFNQTGDISTLNSGPLKLVDKFPYFGSSVSSTENDINTWLAKNWTAIVWLSVLWKSDLSDKMKHVFFQAAVLSILLYGCTTWMLTKRMEKKHDSNYTRMLHAVLSWRQHPTKQQLYSHLPLIMKTIQITRTRYMGHCWRSKGELLWTHSCGRAKVGQPARTYLCSVSWGCRIHQLHLCRGLRPPPPKECLRYDTKQSDSEAPVMLELQGMQSTPSLPLLPGTLWPGVVAPDRAYLWVR